MQFNSGVWMEKDVNQTTEQMKSIVMIDGDNMVHRMSTSVTGIQQHYPWCPGTITPGVYEFVL